MDKRIVQFVIQSKNGVIQRVGRTSIAQPKTSFKGGTVKWYEDKPKKGGSNNGR